jgi:hypothetical protein
VAPAETRRDTSKRLPILPPSKGKMPATRLARVAGPRLSRKKDDEVALGPNMQKAIPPRGSNGLADELRDPLVDALACPIASVQRDEIMLHPGLSLSTREYVSLVRSASLPLETSVLPQAQTAWR